MGALNLLIKPASSSCNLNCSYCFYHDVASHRETENTGIMSQELLEIIVQKALSSGATCCNFVFQGGEPTLAGLSFYKALIKLQQKHNLNEVEINNAIQTNGYLLNSSWARFFASHKFLVGLSIDGTKEGHNLFRKNKKGYGTFERVIESAELLKQHKVDFNVLTVVTPYLANNISEAYNFFKKSEFYYHQYIPCVNPIDDFCGSEEYSLSPDLYLKFLKQLFDLWYEDIQNGEMVSIRYFENLVNMIMGNPPENCAMAGQCTIQYVIESDGTVYPCDFYATDRFSIGSIRRSKFAELFNSPIAQNFLKSSLKINSCCESCEWLSLCRGGCRKDCEILPDFQKGENRYCGVYKQFFSYSIERMGLLADSLLKE